MHFHQRTVVLFFNNRLNSSRAASFLSPSSPWFFRPQCFQTVLQPVAVQCTYAHPGYRIHWHLLARYGTASQTCTRHIMIARRNSLYTDRKTTVFLVWWFTHRLCLILSCFYIWDLHNEHLLYCQFICWVLSRLTIYPNMEKNICCREWQLNNKAIVSTVAQTEKTFSRFLFRQIKQDVPSLLSAIFVFLRSTVTHIGAISW